MVGGIRWSGLLRGFDRQPHAACSGPLRLQEHDSFFSVGAGGEQRLAFNETQLKLKDN